LDEGLEGGVAAGSRSAGGTRTFLQGRGKTRALVIVGDSNVSRPEAGMEKDSGLRFLSVLSLEKELNTEG